MCQTLLSKTFANSEKNTKQIFGKRVRNDTYSLSIRAHTIINHVSICFFTTKKKTLFFRARDEKDIERRIDVSSVVWTLIDNGKLTNQIARFISSNCGKKWNCPVS